MLLVYTPTQESLRRFLSVEHPQPVHGRVRGVSIITFSVNASWQATVSKKINAFDRKAIMLYFVITPCVSVRFLTFIRDVMKLIPLAHRHMLKTVPANLIVAQVATSFSFRREFSLAI